MSDRPPSPHHRLRRAALLYLVAALCLSWGYAAARYRVFPHGAIDPVLSQVEAFLAGGEGEEKTTVERLVLHPQERAPRFDYAGFQTRDGAFRDPGYLLLSRFSTPHRQVVVELVRADGFEVLFRWLAPVEEIIARTEGGIDHVNTRAGYRVQHPLLIEDGGLVFHSGEGSLVRMDRDNRIVWTVSGHFHHSVERLPEGNLIVPINHDPTMLPELPDNQDDGYVILSMDGRILERVSIGRLLMDHGRRGLMMGVGRVGVDRVHLNDVQPIYTDNGVARRGDLALSLRNLSTVLLYRPATDAIVWIKTGPWLYQHDINILPDGTYSVFGNDVFKREGEERAFSQAGAHSAVYRYDPRTDSVTRPYDEVLRRLGMYSPTQGRSRILPNGDVFIEENEHSRLLRVSPDQLRWEFVNGEPGGDRVGVLHWCRYLLPNEVDVSWLNEAKGQT